MAYGIWKFLLQTVAVSAAAIAIVGCSNSSSPSNTSGVTTETFSGTVASAGVDTSHTFVVTKSGTLNVKVTLTQATWPGPLTGTSLVISIGQPFNSGCLTIQSVVTRPGNAPQLSGSANPGAYCLGVADVEDRGAVTYTVTVAHT